MFLAEIIVNKPRTWFQIRFQTKALFLIHKTKIFSFHFSVRYVVVTGEHRS
jgi:hypothetical protein